MVISELKKSWPLEPVTHIEKLPGGAINDSYRVETGKDSYVLRVYTRRKPKEIAFEIKFLEELEGLPVPNLLSIQGKKFFMIQNFPAVIYNYLPGEALRAHTHAHRMEVGRFLRRMHIKGASLKWGAERGKLYDFPDEKIQHFIKTVRRTHDYYDRFEEVLREVQEFELPPGIPQGPIHVDVKPGNVLFLGDALSGVIDFDNAYIGPLVLDLAKAMVWFGIGNGTFNMRQARDVFEGYEEMKKLEDLEREILYDVVKFAFVSHLFVDFYMNAIGGIPESYFDYLMKEFYPAYKTLPVEKEAFYGALGLS